MKKLYPEFLIFEEENWPKIVAKCIKTGTSMDGVEEGLEESLDVKFIMDPVRISKNHPRFGDNYLLLFKSDEDKHKAYMK